MDFYRSPNIWWPDDRAWCVATEIDLMSTFAGGSAACAEAILGDTRFESFPLDPDQGIGEGSDELNR
jgi:hypothetical protein